MEIIGKNFPSLQNAIASGFESVASGIQQSTQLRGPQSIKNAFETFSPANVGTVGSPELLPAVADVGQFAEPAEYFRIQLPDSKFAKIFAEKNFNPIRELSHLGENSLFQRGIIVVGGKLPSANRLDHLNAPPEPILPHPEPAQITTPPGPTGMSASIVTHSPTFNGTADQTETIKNASEQAKHSNTPEDPQYGPGGNSPGEILNDFLSHPEKWKNPLFDATFEGQAKQTETIKRSLQPANLIQGRADQSETIKKASASDADQRAISIVGGKSSGTFFETIDDTLSKMNQNPQPETVQLFEQQVAALQEMSTTIQQSIQMNHQINSAATGRFRV
jgi:hypothetical protein